MKTSSNTILITGGTSGIGRALAERLQAEGNSVVIAGRRQALLDEITTANPGMSGYVLDVEDAQAIGAFSAKVAAEHPGLNVVIANAGIMLAEDLAGGDYLADAEKTVTTNLLGPIRLISALLPHLRRQERAAIVTVSSGLAFVPLAVTPTYCATKAAIHSYSISLRHQLRDTGIEVVELAPPSVQSDLMPGHATDPNAMALPAFIDEVVALLGQEPTPKEILVERMSFFRNAESEGRFDAAFAAVNASG